MLTQLFRLLVSLSVLSAFCTVAAPAQTADGSSSSGSSTTQKQDASSSGSSSGTSAGTQTQDGENSGGEAKPESKSQGNWLYEGQQRVIEAEKKASDDNAGSDKGTDSGGTAAKSVDTKTDASPNVNAAGEQKEGDKKDGDKKADDKKADAEKKPDEKAVADKKDGDKKDGDKKTDSDTKFGDIKANAAHKSDVTDPLKEAMFDLNAQKYDDGIAVLERVLTKQPRNVQAHYVLAVTYVMKRKYPEAVEQYKSVLQIAPATHPIHKLAEEGLKKIHQ